MLERAAVEAALRDEPVPAAVVDLDAFDRNLAFFHRVTGQRPLRLATKSIRCVALLRRAAEALGERFGGLMTVSPRESLALAERGFDDLWVAYPVARRADARPLVELARRGVLARIVVDGPAQVELLSDLAREAGVVLPVVVDVDCSWRPGAGLHVGVRRSPVRSAAAAVELARTIAGRGGLRLDGVQIYEAHLAGVADRGPRGAVVRFMKARARPRVRSLRAAIVAALRDAGHAVEHVNGGGTGSAAWTAEDPVITEVTVGSGLLAPHLFDGYDDLELVPAAFAVLSITRRSDPDHVTVHGGGYPASGAAGADRLPRVARPSGLAPTALEGFGEVQTPLVGTATRALSPGELVLVRHAKAGELLERFDRVHLLSEGSAPQAVSTYRADGIVLG